MWDIETVNHYLLSCPNYQQLRQLYLDNLPCPPIADNLLYGNERLSFEDNKNVFLQVQIYIGHQTLLISILVDSLSVNLYV